MTAHTRPTPPSPIRREPRARRAFTLLEIMLALIIGGLVVTTALGTFMALQRADKQNRQRLESSMELAQAHRAVELALRSMVLSNTRPPSAEVPLPTDRPGQPARPAAPAPLPEPTEFERPRVLLSRDGSGSSMIWLDPSGRPVELEPQRLEITIERPPVFPEPLPGENFRPVVHRMYASRHQRDREKRRDEREADRAERGPGEEENPFDTTEPAIAAGVRGAFELSWEPQQRRPGETIDPEGGSWTLWWRTLPPIVAIPDAETTEGLSLDELRSNPMYRRVKLASNLRWCRWEAVRAGETLSEFQSTWWEDLPAYVTLELQTVSGKWSKWMFEVQGTRGAEPGTVTGEEAPTPTGESIESAIDEAVERIGNESGGTRSAPGRRGGRR